MSSRVERMNAQMCREFEGTFVPENRNEVGIHGSTRFTPEIAEEEERIIHNDRLHTRRPNKTFKSRERVKGVDYRGRVCEVTEIRDEWMLNAPFVPLDEIPADPSILMTDVPENIRDESELSD